MERDGRVHRGGRGDAQADDHLHLNGFRKERAGRLDEIGLDVAWTFVPHKDTAIPVEVKEQKTTGTSLFDRGRGVLLSREEREQMKAVGSILGEKIETQTQGTVTWKLLPPRGD